MSTFTTKLLVLMMLTGFVPVMVNAEQMKNSSSMDHSEMDQSVMDHSNMDHSTMSSTGMKQDTMQPGMKGHEGMSSSMNMPADNAGIASSTPVMKMFPASGKVREAGFEGNYLMKQTTVESNIETKCALASRGIVMLDREGWKKCTVQSGGLKK